MRAAPAADVAPDACATCARILPSRAFSRSQLTKAHPKCRECVKSALQTPPPDAEPRSRRCVQCFRDLPPGAFSKRQRKLQSGKCVECVDALEKAAVSAQPAGKWSYDCYYRACHKAVSVRVKCNIASPIGGHIPFGRVFRATGVICNEQGDPMVKVESLYLDAIVPVSSSSTTTNNDDDSTASTASTTSTVKHRDGWVPCRSIRNEVLIEPHHGPFRTTGAPSDSRYYRCVVEGCKARVRPELELSEIGYVLYGDVVEVVQAVVTAEGVVFLQLHSRYFDETAWVVERTLDNGSVLNAVEGPSTATETYRCVQGTGAPLRLEPSLSSPPVGRIPCGALVEVVERVVNAERQVFLRLRLDANPQVALVSGQDSSDVDSEVEAATDAWVIETSTCCASVMIKASKPSIHWRH